MLNPANPDLLQAIHQHEPESMRAVAELIDRECKKVPRNLTELDLLNPINPIEDGRSKRLLVHFDEIDINLSLDSTDKETATA